MTDYVLHDREAAELDRLGFQHGVWREETERLLELGGIAPGDAVLDLGCGPGFLSLDLLARVGPQGRVTALDSSAGFTRYLEEQATERSLDNLEVVQADALTHSFAPGTFDRAVCRWVLMFLQAPERIVTKAYDALGPGGTLAVMEYYPFLDISLSTGEEVFDRVYRAVARLITRFGGDADTGGRVPGMMQEAGFVDIESREISRSDSPGSPLWRWIQRTGENHDNLVEHGLLSAEELREYRELMARCETAEDVLFRAPTVQLIVGHKR